MRVLALTHNASLLVALGSMMREWEVISVRDVEAAQGTEPAAVALIDVGDTQEGLKAATELYQSGITIPCVVLGDEPADGGHASILVRPFSLEDLATAVREASTRPAAPAPPAVAPGPVEEPRPASGPREGRRERNGAAATAPALRSEPAPAPAQPPAPAEKPAAKSQKARPFTVVPPAKPDEIERPVAGRPAEPVAEEPEAPAPQPAAPAAPEPTPEPTPEPEPEEPARVSETVARIEAELAPQTEREPIAPPQEPQPARVDVQPPPQRQAPAASSAATAPDLAQQPAAQQGRWRLRRKPPARTGAAAESAESPVVRQLKQAARNAADLETLIEELPFLRDLAGLADGLVAEVEAQFATQVASVFVRREDGYHAVAYRGLSRVESGMVVPETQPLFSDVLQTGEGILIQPVDLAQGLVAGIGGARTEAIMGVPAVVHGACVAVIIAGRSRFTENDLDRLSDLASEAAPGLAVALALARLRERI